MSLVFRRCKVICSCGDIQYSLFAIDPTGQNITTGEAYRIELYGEHTEEDLNQELFHVLDALLHPVIEIQKNHCHHLKYSF